MSEENSQKKSARKSLSLVEKIALQRETLRKLEAKQRENERIEREKNQKGVLELIRAEKLDSVPPEKWKEVMPQLKTLLAIDTAKSL